MEYIAVVIKVTPKLFSVMKVHAWRDCITGCIQALRFYVDSCCRRNSLGFTFEENMDSFGSTCFTPGN
jgi:hypothetical protein